MNIKLTIFQKIYSCPGSLALVQAKVTLKELLYLSEIRLNGSALWASALVLGVALKAEWPVFERGKVFKGRRKQSGQIVAMKFISKRGKAEKDKERVVKMPDVDHSEATIESCCSHRRLRWDLI